MYEKTLSKKTVYEGRIIDVDVLEVELENGKRSVREIVQHGVAVAIIPMLPDGRFVFIRQFRKPMDRICFEVCAGNVDHEGEHEAETALRELQEETGYLAESMELLGPIYPSVGYCTERIDVFFCEVTGHGETNFDDDERIDTVIVSESQMDEMIRTNQISDSKTLAAWMLYKAKKARLKRQAMKHRMMQRSRPKVAGQYLLAYLVSCVIGVLFYVLLVPRMHFSSVAYFLAPLYFPQALLAYLYLLKLDAQLELKLASLFYYLVYALYIGTFMLGVSYRKRVIYYFFVVLLILNIGGCVMGGVEDRNKNSEPGIVHNATQNSEPA